MSLRAFLLRLEGELDEWARRLEESVQDGQSTDDGQRVARDIAVHLADAGIACRVQARTKPSEVVATEKLLSLEIWISIDKQGHACGVFNNEAFAKEDAETYGDGWRVEGPYRRPVKEGEVYLTGSVARDLPTFAFMLPSTRLEADAGPRDAVIQAAREWLDDFRARTDHHTLATAFNRQWATLFHAFNRLDALPPSTSPLETEMPAPTSARPRPADGHPRDHLECAGCGVWCPGSEKPEKWTEERVGVVGRMYCYECSEKRRRAAGESPEEEHRRVTGCEVDHTNGSADCYTPRPRPSEPKKTCGWCKGNPIGDCAICQAKPSSPETYADDSPTCGEATPWGPCTRTKGHLSPGHWRVHEDVPEPAPDAFRAEAAGYESALREVDQTILMAHRAGEDDLTRGWNTALSHIAIDIKRKLQRSTSARPRPAEAIPNHIDCDACAGTIYPEQDVIHLCGPHYRLRTVPHG